MPALPACVAQRPAAAPPRPMGPEIGSSPSLRHIPSTRGEICRWFARPTSTFPVVRKDAFFTSGNFTQAVLAAAHSTRSPYSHFRPCLTSLDFRQRTRFLSRHTNTRAPTHLCTASILMSLISANACMCLARACPLFPVAVGHAHSSPAQRTRRRYRTAAARFPAQPMLPQVSGCFSWPLQSSPAADRHDHHDRRV